MIYTVTVSPAIDYVVHLDSFETGATNRTTAEEYYFGGKGINVSRVLKELGLPSVALGFVGGFTGQALEKGLKDAGIETDFVHVREGVTRINVKIKAEKETEINGQGAIPDDGELCRLTKKLEKMENGDILIISGNIPAAMPQDTYDRLMDAAGGKDIRLIVDTNGELLVRAPRYRPFLVKPNLEELKGIFGMEITAYEGASRLREKGARNVIVSMGGDGAVLAAEDGNCYEAGVCSGDVINTVGSGDSMVAGFLAGYMETGDYQYALDMGSAAGSATAISPGLAERGLIEACLGKLRRADR